MNDQVNLYLEQNADRFVDELKEFLRIPTVSADPACKPHMTRGAEFVYRQFSNLGFQAEIVPTAGHPIVYAEWLKSPGAPTVMVYGHYDVQPADPLDLWTTPPFEPTLRNGCLYARGATDDKGQVFTHIKSAESWLRTLGKLPVNLKYVIEGEEEVGSDSLPEFLKRYKTDLQCDGIIISDTGIPSLRQPALTYALRGVLAMEIKVVGPNRDLHSGLFGGSVDNPAMVLCQLLAPLRDKRGRITIPGFYDDVVPLTKLERRELARLPFNESAYRKFLGVPKLFGEQGHTPMEQKCARPTLEINGLTSGYQGDGSKTIIPSWASAKLTMRLVPNQTTAKLRRIVTAHLKKP